MSPTDDGTGVHRTGRWRGIGAATLVAAALGLVARRPALLLASAVGVALLAYARVVSAPPLSLSLQRTTSTDAADPGEPIRVELTVRNAGERAIPDLRLVDGVPEHLAVVEGTPAIGTALAPGATASCSYAVEARAGSHEFGPAVAVARDVAGVVERLDRIAVDDAEEVAASQPAALRTSPPLRTDAARYVGQRTADASGEGVAFDSVREYRHGDAPGRVDWRRLARTGELATVEFQEERGVNVVVAVDARPSAARARAPDEPTAVERGLAGATALVERLAADGHRVGVAQLGAERHWIAPGRGPRHRRQATDLLAERSTLDGERPDRTVTGDDAECPALAWLREQVPARTEVLFLTPALDDAVVDGARRLDASGTPVTVLSPDPTDDATPGRRLARLERRQRLRALAGSGVPVLDWPNDEPLEQVIRRSRAGRAPTASRRESNWQRETAARGGEAASREAATRRGQTAGRNVAADRAGSQNETEDRAGSQNGTEDRAGSQNETEDRP